jgi:Ca2+/Na+ antiporter
MFEPEIVKGTEGGAVKSIRSIGKRSPSYERETLKQNNRTNIFLFVAFLLVLIFFFEYLKGNPDTWVSIGFLALLGLFVWVIGQPRVRSSQE